MPYSIISSATLKENIENLVPLLLNMARDLTWNKISENCMFILSEIPNRSIMPYEERRLRIKENNKKIPIPFSAIVSHLENIYVDLYDINLFIHRSTKKLTIIDIRYYSKLSLKESFRQEVINNPPMLHAKVINPPWLTDEKKKFNINWEHNEKWTKWKSFWTSLKLKAEARKRSKK